MIARRLSYSFLFAAVLAFAGPTFAQKPATAPKDATAQCKDDTYSTAKTERGACSKHGGVKTWFGASEPAAKAPGAKAPAAAPVSKTPAAQPAPKMPVSGKASASAQPPESATGQCQDGTYTRAKTQKGACSTHGGVKTWFAGAQPPATSAPQAAPGNQPRPAPAPLSPASTPAPKGGAAKAAPKSVPPAGAPVNATAKCKDGTYSLAKTHSGACSHHGGVAEWYK